MKTFRDILLRHDEVGAYEQPHSFDRRAALGTVVELIARLNTRFSSDFALDDHVEDASFLCDIIIPEGLVQAWQPNLGYAIRISNFGQLASICFEENILQEALELVKSDLQGAGFTYLPASVLQDMDYDGRFEDFKSLNGPERLVTWWHRYFDYL